VQCSTQAAMHVGSQAAANAGHLRALVIEACEHMGAICLTGGLRLLAEPWLALPLSEYRPAAVPAFKRRKTRALARQKGNSGLPGIRPIPRNDYRAGKVASHQPVHGESQKMPEIRPFLINYRARTVMARPRAHPYKSAPRGTGRVMSDGEGDRA
jgi:hypothetical protein